MLWILLAVLTAVVTLVLSRPLIRPADDVSADAAATTAVYKDQLAEIEVDRERGLIGGAEADAARAEIARRLLHHTTASSSSTPSSGPGPLRRLELSLIAVPVAAMVLYVWLGSPQLPAVPLATREPAPAADAQVADLIKRVEDQLKTTPNDGRGWEVIAPIYLRMQRYDAAAYAYSQSIRLNGETPARLMGFAQADMLGNKGVVSDAVKKAAERILALTPESIEPKIWLALAKEQGGDINGAIADYQALVTAAPSDAPWRSPVEDQIAKLKGLQNNPTAAALPPDSVPTPITPPASAQNPAVSSPEAIAALPAAEQQKMIASMVDKLAARLRENGDDAAGWQRLIRAYQVMGRADDANTALASARKQFGSDAKVLAEINQFASSLGLK